MDFFVCCTFYFGELFHFMYFPNPGDPQIALAKENHKNYQNSKNKADANAAIPRVCPRGTFKLDGHTDNNVLFENIFRFLNI